MEGRGERDRQTDRHIGRKRERGGGGGGQTHR